MSARPEWGNGRSIILIVALIAFPVVAGLGARYLENRDDEQVGAAVPASAPSVVVEEEPIASPEPSEPVATDHTAADLARADFYAQSLQGVGFDRANLRRASFVEAELGGATFVGADLRKADFSYANLSGADLRDSDLTGALFDQTVLRDADLRGATLDGVSFSSAIGVTEGWLARTLGVPEARLAYELHDRRIRLGFVDEYGSGIERACKGRGIAAAGRYQGGAGFHPMVVVGPPDAAWNAKATRRRWDPMAMRYLELVACAEELKPQKIESCGLYAGGGFSNVVYQAREHWRIRVVEARTGRVLYERSYLGSEPKGDCPSTVYAGTKYLTTGDIRFEEVEATLAGYVGTPPGS